MCDFHRLRGSSVAATLASPSRFPDPEAVEWVRMKSDAAFPQDGDFKTMKTQFAVPLDALDEVVVLGERSIRTVKKIRADEPYFTGHYPDHPIYPGVFLVEAVIQAVRAQLAWSRRPHQFVEVISTRFLAPVRPGDTLEMVCDLGSGETADEIVARAVCLTGGILAANIKLRFQRKDPDAQSP
jgi:3-hydroxyacyl-[acyl-carrier-protein] dehydratase